METGPIRTASLTLPRLPADCECLHQLPELRPHPPGYTHQAPRAVPWLLIHTHLWGVAKGWKQNVRNTSAPFILSTGIPTTTPFISLIYSLPPLPTHPLQVSERQAVRHAESETAQSPSKSRRDAWPKLLLVLWSPAAALLQHSKSSVTAWYKGTLLKNMTSPWPERFKELTDLHFIK